MNFPVVLGAGLGQLDMQCLNNFKLALNRALARFGVFNTDVVGWLCAILFERRLNSRTSYTQNIKCVSSNVILVLQLSFSHDVHFEHHYPTGRRQ